MGPEQLLGAVAAEIAAERIVSVTRDTLSQFSDEGLDEERQQRIEGYVEQRDMEGLVMELNEAERQELEDALRDLCYQHDINPNNVRPQQ